MWIVSSIDKVLKPNAIALGNFDGIHRGHKKVLQPILPKYEGFGCHSPLSNGKQDTLKEQYNYATVVSFNPHPKEFFTGQKRSLLTPLTEKVQLLESLGIQQLVLLPFDHYLASLTPQEFVAEIVVKKLQATKISVGEDFCFGKGRQGTAEDLKAIASQFGIEVIIIKDILCQDDTDEHNSIRISTSFIRQELEAGKIEVANDLLGRNYTLTGKVVEGQKLGRKIGFPTANLSLPSEKFLPRCGVYGATVILDPNLSYNPSLEGTNINIGVVNIGYRPTVDGNNLTVEVHLLDWVGNLYGKTITVSLETFLRPEQKFSSIDQLKTQISFDCDRSRLFLLSQTGCDKKK